MISYNISMKSDPFIFFKSAAIYLFVIIFGTVGCSLIYMIYSLCTGLVAGQGFTMFNMDHFVNGMFLSAPVVIVLSSIFMVLYFIRHRASGLGIFLVFGVIYAVMWIAVIPLIISSYKDYKEEIIKSDKAVVLSTGYFRDNGNQIFYYSKISNQNVASGVCIDKYSAEKKFRTFKNVQLPYTAKFNDPLIQESVKIPVLLELSVGAVNELNRMMEFFTSNGILSWLSFCLMGCAIFCVSFIRNVSKWRLVNVCSIAFCTLAIVVFNILIFSDGLIHSMAQRINDVVALPQKFNLSMMIFNVLVSAVLVVFSIISSRAGSSMDFAADGEDE